MKIPVNTTPNAVNDHHRTLRIADEPGNIIVESALPMAIRLIGIQYSTAHIIDMLHLNAAVDVLPTFTAFDW